MGINQRALCLILIKDVHIVMIVLGGALNTDKLFDTSI